MNSVILDSNILRGWQEPPAFDAFLRAEKTRGIVQLADSWTLLELLSNLADPTVPAYGQSLAGLRRATKRSLLDDPPRLVYPAEAQIAALLFGAYPPDIDATMTELVACCRYIYAEPPESALEAALPTIRDVHTHNENLETFFATSSRALRDQVLNAPVDAKEKVAKEQARAFLHSREAASADTLALVKRAYSQMGRIPPDSLHPDELERVATATRVGSAALTLALESILCDGANPDNSRIKNFLWDQEIAFSLGNQMAGHPVILVTTDGIFRRAAAEAGAPGSVCSLPDHIAGVNAA